MAKDKQKNNDTPNPGVENTDLEGKSQEKVNSLPEGVNTPEERKQMDKENEAAREQERRDEENRAAKESEDASA